MEINNLMKRAEFPLFLYKHERGGVSTKAKSDYIKLLKYIREDIYWL